MTRRWTPTRPTPRTVVWAVAAALFVTGFFLVAGRYTQSPPDSTLNFYFTSSGWDAVSTVPQLFLPAAAILAALVGLRVARVRNDSLGRALLLACSGGPLLVLLALMVRPQIGGWYIVGFREGYYSWLLCTLLLTGLAATGRRPVPDRYET